VRHPKFLFLLVEEIKNVEVIPRFGFGLDEIGHCFESTAYID